MSQVLFLLITKPFLEIANFIDLVICEITYVHKFLSFKSAESILRTINKVTYIFKFVLSKFSTSIVSVFVESSLINKFLTCLFIQPT